jgi:8-oxo-dGTP diphosphatase
MVKTPLLTVDVVVRIWRDGVFSGVVLIERKNAPKGWALPGGFVDVGESVEEAAIREMAEEISLPVRLARLLGVYSSPDRDPRFHTASVVFIGDAEGDPKAASDAAETRVFPLEAIPFSQLVFDHERILLDFIRR